MKFVIFKFSSLTFSLYFSIYDLEAANFIFTLSLSYLLFLFISGIICSSFFILFKLCFSIVLLLLASFVFISSEQNLFNSGLLSLFDGSLFIRIVSYIPFISAILSPSLLLSGVIGLKEIILSTN